jgi:ATP-dependent exoDNAse (exonuclease V) alpha subunit
MKKAAEEKSPNARRLMFKAAYDFKDTFANIDYSYAITSHKSQGSGYGISVVDVEDISSVKMNTNKTKSRSNYTAITRAIDTALIITKEADTNKKNIRQALNVEKKSKRENTGNPKDMGCI